MNACVIGKGEPAEEKDIMEKGDQGAEDYRARTGNNARKQSQQGQDEWPVFFFLWLAHVFGPWQNETLGWKKYA